MRPAWSLEPGSGGAVAPLPPPAPPLLPRIPFWVKGDAGVTSAGGLLTGWADQGTLAQDLDLTEAGKEPGFGGDTLDGIPGATWPVADVINGPQSLKYIARAATLKATDAVDFGLSPDHPARTVMAVIRPRNIGIVCNPGAHECYQTGGPVVQFRLQATGFGSFDATFMLQAYFNSFQPQFFVYSSFGGAYGPYPVRGPATLGSVYADLPLLVEWRADYPALAVAVNGGADLALTPSPLTGDAYDGGPNPAPNGFVLGNAGLGTAYSFQGSIFEVIVWDLVLTGADLTAARNYFAARYPSIGIVT